MITEGYKDTEIGLIPVEWDVVELDGIVEFKNGKGHEQVIDENGQYIVVNSKFISTSGNIYKSSNSNLSPLKPNDITLVMSDIPNGKALAKCFYIKEDDRYTLNQRICSLTAIKDNPLYLFYRLNRNKYFLKFNDGVNQTNLRKNEVLECKIPLPPLKEQEKIADILSTADAKIDAVALQIEKAETLKKGLLQKLLNEGIGHSEFKDSEIGKIPESWEASLIGNNMTFSGGAQPPRNTFVFEPQEGYTRLLQIRDYKSNKFQTYIPKKLVRKSCFKDDVMIGRYGPPIFQILRGLEGAYNVALIKAIPNTTIDKEFMYYVLVQEKLFSFIENLSQRSSGQTGIDMEGLKTYPLPLPPLEEQKQIAEILSTADEKLEVLRAKKEKYETLKKGLLQKLLSGEVRV